MAAHQANIRTFRAPLRGPGRLAPTLIEDLTLYDPHWDSAPGRNLLDDPAINFGNTDFLRQILHPSSCHHAFYIQPRRTKSPQLDERPTPTSIYHVTALCRLCAIHVTLKVDYTKNWAGLPCPNEGRPVHHLVQSSYNQQLARSNWSRQNPRSSDEIYVYECTSSSCGVQVTVTLSPGVLRPDEVHTLTDPELLSQRTDAAFESRRGETEGMKRPSPTDVLVDLRAYIRNSWRKDARTEIALDNKRFAVRFGPNGDVCKEVLENLGFKLKPGEWWQVPRINPDDTLPLQDSFNIFLDNLEHELNALILKRPIEERSASQDTTTLEDAGKEFARALSCQAYDRIPSARTSSTTPGDRRSFFIVLGTPENASDNLVKFAYDSQCWSCPEYSPTFLSALRDIGFARESDDLNYKVAIEVSKGKVDAEQLSAAYQALGVPMTIQSDADESHIIGTFNARLADAPSQEVELREFLRTIGLGLNSKKITDYAAREISNYDQALLYLNANPDTSDDWIPSLYSVKLTESPSNIDLATKAVKIIAAQRQSKELQSWVDSGFAANMSTDMDIGTAYQALDIADRTMDDPTLLTIYEIRKQEDPSNTERYTTALRTIARDRDSTMLLSELHISRPERSPKSMLGPVGLDNIGNTCYLNSLLQSLFTIRAVREVVLNFDFYKMDPTTENMAAKKVGQRKLSVKEVDTAQKFVRNLAILFDSMITTPKPAIRPSQELARLTLETDTIERIRRRSTLAGGARPNLGSIDHKLIQGPQLPPAMQASGETEEPMLTPDVFTMTPDGEHSRELGVESTQLGQLLNIDRDDDNSSEATLVSRPSSVDHMDLEAATAEQQQMILDNKENLNPAKIDEFREPLLPMEPLRPASPSKINIQAGALLKSSDEESDTTSYPQEQPRENVQKYAPPPGPPPIPPRKPVDTMPTLEEYARQQDVTEVFNHCVLQLSCAIRPTGFENSGEQKDEIHDLFFGDVSTHAIPEKETIDTDAFLNIMVPINNVPKDIYAALDNNFDLSDIGRKSYQSVSKLPPILTIALGRVVWDGVKNCHVKLENFVEMPETVYLDRYLEADSDSHLIEIRHRSWKLKERVTSLIQDKAKLEKEHAGAKDVPSLFDDAKRALLFLRDIVPQEEEYGGPITFDPSLPDKLAEIAGRSRNKLSSINQEIDDINQELSTMFNGLQDHPYNLHAVFFHRGSHGSGHYWIYIRDHESGVWRKYNDDHVDIVQDTKEIFSPPETTGGWSGPANAYFLVYVRSDEAAGGVHKYVETVKRNPIEAADPEPEPEPDAYLEPLGGFEGYRPGGPSQMTEMPPDTAAGYGKESTAAWASEVTASQVEPEREWDDSESRQDLEKWYR